MNLKKTILKVFSANFIQLITSLIVGFIVPAILSIESYANLKTYTLIISYIGLLHFGFVDGMYIKYGGKKIDEIDKGILKGEHSFFVFFEFLISIILFIISLIFKDVIIFLFSISILPIMIQNFFKSLYQATGNFDKYSKVIYMYTISYMFLNVLLAIIFKSENYIYYCLTTFGANLFSVFISEYKFIKEYSKVNAIINKDILNNVKTGFFILLGNLSVMALFGLDKWFVKIFLTTEDFAYYSFAVSMLNIINTLVSAISITFYNYLFYNNSKESISKLRKYLITLGAGASAGYFVLSFIINNFMKKYIPALNIISITFSVFPYMILINALYVNLYKVNKDEKKYFKVVVSMLIVSIVYNIVAILIFKNTIAIAYATILTLITWVIYSTNDLENVAFDKNVYIYMFLSTVLFLMTAGIKNYILGLLIYIVSFMILTIIINKTIIDDFMNELKKYMERIRNGKNTK